MTKRSLRVGVFLLALGLPMAAPGVQAQERGAPVPLLLNLLNVPVDSPETAFRESLRAEPTPRPSPEWVILPDGSARYGTDRFALIVRRPCVYPPPPALSGTSSR